MNRYSLTHVDDQALVSNLRALVAHGCSNTADVAAHIAEVDDRKLYLPAAYPSMYLYCVHELHLSEDAACKRIAAARAARQFPAIFLALAEGRLHLSAIVMLTPHLTPENAEELLAAAAHRTKPELQQLLAQRFPRPDLPSQVRALPAPASSTELLAPGPLPQSAPGRIEVHVSRLEPLSPERFALQTTLGRSVHDKLRYLQALLGHQVSSGDLEAALEYAFDAGIERAEKRKFAATSRPRRGAKRSSHDPRHIPADVRRTVCERDGGRCTFTSDNGRRCPATTRLEFDHIEPVARGGQATAENVRLRCKAHNQYEAEQTFGAGFMSRKREEAKSARAQARAQAAPADPEKDVTPWLRKLGFSVSEARLAAERCESIPDASLEDRIRFALRLLAPPHRTVHPTMAT